MHSDEGVGDPLTEGAHAGAAGSHVVHMVDG